MTDMYDQREPLLVALEPGSMPVEVKPIVDGILYHRSYSVAALLTAQDIVREALPGLTAFLDDGQPGHDANQRIETPTIRGEYYGYSETYGSELVRWAARTFL